MTGQHFTLKTARLVLAPVSHEIAQAVVDYCFDALAMTMVNASTDAGNARSIRVLEKLGVTFIRRSNVEGLDTVFYRLPRRRASRQN